MCYDEGELHSHLFLHCLVAWEMWNRLFGVCGGFWLVPSSVLLTFPRSFGRRKDCKTLWSSAFFGWRGIGEIFRIVTILGNFFGIGEFSWLLYGVMWQGPLAEFLWQMSTEIGKSLCFDFYFCFSFVYLLSEDALSCILSFF